MQLKAMNYFDDETLEHVGSKFFIDGEEVSFEVYSDFVEELFEGKECIEDDECCCEECKDEVDENPFIYENCEPECEDCDCELSDEEVEEMKLITSFVEDVLETNGCPGCIFDKLMEVYLIGKEIGWSNHKAYIDACNEE